MRGRSAHGVVGWSLASAGAYAIVWLVETRREMNQLGARIPSPWLLVFPITALYWAWCWSEGDRQPDRPGVATGMEPDNDVLDAYSGAVSGVAEALLPSVASLSVRTRRG